MLGEQTIKRLVKQVVSRAGFELVRTKNCPDKNLLGLRNLGICSVVDVGANTGQFAKRIAEALPDADLFCFEPLPGPYAELSKWGRSHPGNVQTFPVAIGDTEEVVQMNFHVDFSPSSSLLQTTTKNEALYPFTKKQEQVPVEVTRLDRAMEPLLQGLRREILIKVDVQGVEDKVIRGGAKTFGQAKACILEVSIEPLYDGQATFEDLGAMMGNLGFRYVGNLSQAYDEDGSVIFFDAVFRKD